MGMTKQAKMTNYNMKFDSITVGSSMVCMVTCEAVIEGRLVLATNPENLSHGCHRTDTCFF